MDHIRLKYVFTKVRTYITFLNNVRVRYAYGKYALNFVELATLLVRTIDIRSNISPKLHELELVPYWSFLADHTHLTVALMHC